MFFLLRRGLFFKPLTLIKSALAALLLLAVGPLLAADSAANLAGNLASLLQGQQHVLLIRHADAPGVGDPAGFSLKDCATQRNLGQRGRQQAVEMGQWLKAQGVVGARVLTSPWCRTRDTASGMAVGQVSDAASLASFFETQSRRESQNTALQVLLREQLQSKGRQPLIMVTHQVNITEYTGEYLASGAMLLIKVDAAGMPLSVQRLSAF